MFDGNHAPLVVAATCDIHGHLEGIFEVCNSRGVDILVLAGDIEPSDPFISKQDWFERKFFHLVSKLNCEVVAIPGNHDFFLSSKYEAIRRGVYKEIPKNFNILIDEEIQIRGIRFYGTPWVPYINGKWCFEGVDEDLADWFSQIPDKVDVLITHTPPYVSNSTIDMSCAYPKEYRRHLGSKSLMRAIADKSPRIVFCGHIHSGDHGSTEVISNDGSMVQMFNVSRVDENYNVSYKIKLIELGPFGIKELSTTTVSLQNTGVGNGDI